jgi:hypothetical protein
MLLANSAPTLLVSASELRFATHSAYSLAAFWPLFFSPARDPVVFHPFVGRENQPMVFSLTLGYVQSVPGQR